MNDSMQPLSVTNQSGAGVLEITWADGVVGRTGHRQLRESCRCALCVAAARRGQAVLVDDRIRITAIEPYGNNTLRLSFDDGHQRGLYPFDYLRALTGES